MAAWLPAEGGDGGELERGSKGGGEADLAPLEYPVPSTALYMFAPPKAGLARGEGERRLSWVLGAAGKEGSGGEGDLPCRVDAMSKGA